MAKTNSQITVQGKAITVLGTSLKVGDNFPDFRLVGNDMQELNSSKITGKTAVISVVPSLDTEVCSVSTRKFNQEFTGLSSDSDVVVLTVSRDLPFAQKRWCGAEGVTQVVTASDYKFRTFGEATGTLWKEAELLARAVFVVDKGGKIAYVDYIPEIAQEPNYDEVIAAVKAAS